MEISPLDSLIKEIKQDKVEALKAIIARKDIERFFVDFKLTEQVDYSGKRSLYDKDAKNLAKAISGFGNSEGGLLIRGIDTHGKNDVATKLQPIINPQNFAACINSQVSRLVVPLHSTVDNFVIEEEPGTGYVITIIPKSNKAPHQYIQENRFYMRGGDSFVDVPYSVLAGMFGKRPAPNIEYEFNVNINNKFEIDGLFINFSILIINYGMGIAHDIYFSTLAFIEDSSTKLAFNYPSNNFKYNTVYGIGMNGFSLPDFKLGMEQRVLPLSYDIRIKPPFKEDFFLKILIGCEGQPPKNCEIKLTPAELDEIYNYAVNNPLAQDVTSKFVKHNNLLSKD